MHTGVYNDGSTIGGRSMRTDCSIPIFALTGSLRLDIHRRKAASRERAGQRQSLFESNHTANVCNAAGNGRL